MNLDVTLVEQAQREGVTRYVVGAVILIESQVLLLERPVDEFMGGIYELPSGKVEEGETLSIALRREVEEETGLQIETIIRYLGHFDYRSKSGEMTREFNFLVSVREPLEIKLQEHNNYTWADWNQLNNYPVTGEVKEVLRLVW